MLYLQSRSMPTTVYALSGSVAFSFRKREVKERRILVMSLCILMFKFWPTIVNLFSSFIFFINPMLNHLPIGREWWGCWPDRHATNWRFLNFTTKWLFNILLNCELNCDFKTDSPTNLFTIFWRTYPKWDWVSISLMCMWITALMTKSSPNFHLFFHVG